MSTYIGVDGGGTKTQVLLMNGEKGATLIGPSSNPNAIGWTNAEQVVTQAIHDCLNALNLSAEMVQGLSICMSGVDRKDEVIRLRTNFHEMFPNAVLEIRNDALAALTAGTRGQPGVVLIAGTGSIAVGESETGEVARSGGYGYLLGDEGSGFTIGRSGLIAAIQSFEGRAQKTALWEQAAEVYQVSRANELIPIVYRSDRPVNKIAHFARMVVSLADTDAVANDIVSTVVSEYLELIQAVFRSLNGNLSRTVVLAGGLFTNTDVLVRRLQAADPTMGFVPLTYSGASGAVLRAIKESYKLSLKSQDDAVAFWELNINNLMKANSVKEDGTVVVYP